LQDNNIYMKKNLIIALSLLISSIIVSSCKKQPAPVLNNKPNLNEVASDPARLGFIKIDADSPQALKRSLTKDVFLKYNVYVNDALDGIFMIKKNAGVKPRSVVDREYQFFSYYCITSNSISPYQPLLVADDSGTRAEYGIIADRYVLGLVLYGGSLFWVNDDGWWAADEGYFNLDVSNIVADYGDYNSFVNAFDNAINHAPDGWIKKQ